MVNLLPAESDRSPENTRATLLDRLHAGDRVAADAFARYYRPLVYDYASRWLQPADADEVAQEVCFRMCRRPLKYNRELKPGSFRAYLRVVVRNAVNAFFRRRAAEEGQGPSVGVTDLPAIPDIDLGELDEILAQRDLIRRALEFIRLDFDPVNWAAFVRVRLEGEDAAKVAADLDKKASTLQVAYNRIMKRLSEEIGRMGGRRIPLGFA